MELEQILTFLSNQENISTNVLLMVIIIALSKGHIITKGQADERDALRSEKDTALEEAYKVGAKITGEAIGHELAKAMEECMERVQVMVSASVERGISKGVQDLAPIIRADTINVTDRIVAIEKKIDELAEVNRNRRGRL